jgi:hypothetical protein
MHLLTLLSTSLAVFWPFFASFTNLWYVTGRLPHGVSLALIWLGRKFFTYFNGKAHLVEEKLHETYGHVIRTGPTNLSFSSLTAFEAIYGFNRSLEKDDFYTLAATPGPRKNVPSVLVLMQHRKFRRRVVGPALSPGKAATYEPIISKNFSTFPTQLAAQSTSRHDSTVNIALLIHRFTFNTTVEIIYGEPVSFNRTLREVTMSSQASGITPVWHGAVRSFPGWAGSRQLR